MDLYQMHIGFPDCLDICISREDFSYSCRSSYKSDSKSLAHGDCVSCTNKTLFQCLCSANKCDLNILSGALRTIRLRRVSTQGYRIQLHTFPTSSASGTKDISFILMHKYYQAPKYNAKCVKLFERTV